MESFFSIVVVVTGAYLLGSIPFGLVVARIFCGIDPRHAGSRNVGATNVARLCGVKWGGITLACDLLKGFLPVLLFVTTKNDLGWLAFPVGLAVICGHMFSLFLRFKGGKGVSSTVGVFLALAPVQLLVAAILCILIIWRTGFVSAGSLTLAATLPLLFVLFGRRGELALALVTGCLVLWAHRENIRRLLRGEEKPWLKNRCNPKA